MYAVRRVKDAFREHKDVQDTERQRTLIQTAQNNLEVMKRQVRICLSPTKKGMLHAFFDP